MREIGIEGEKENVNESEERLVEGGVEEEGEKEEELERIQHFKFYKIDQANNGAASLFRSSFLKYSFICSPFLSTLTLP